MDEPLIPQQFLSTAGSHPVNPANPQPPPPQPAPGHHQPGQPPPTPPPQQVPNQPIGPLPGEPQQPNHQGPGHIPPGQPQQPYPGPGPMPDARSVVSVPYAELQGLIAAQTQLAGIQQQAAESERLRREAEITRHQERGQLDQAITLLRQNATTREAELTGQLTTATQRFTNTLRTAEIVRALAGRTDLAEGAIVHLERNLAADPMIEVVPDGDQFRVRTRTLQSVTDYLADMLTRPENRLFLRPTSAGGTGGPQFSQQPGLPQLPIGQPANLGQAALWDAMEESGRLTPETARAAITQRAGFTSPLVNHTNN